MNTRYISLFIAIAIIVVAARADWLLLRRNVELSIFDPQSGVAKPFQQNATISTNYYPRLVVDAKAKQFFWVNWDRTTADTRTTLYRHNIANNRNGAHTFDMDIQELLFDSEKSVLYLLEKRGKRWILNILDQSDWSVKVASKLDLNNLSPIWFKYAEEENMLYVTGFSGSELTMLQVTIPDGEVVHSFPSTASAAIPTFYDASRETLLFVDNLDTYAYHKFNYYETDVKTGKTTDPILIYDTPVGELLNFIGYDSQKNIIVIILIQEGKSDLKVLQFDVDQKKIVSTSSLNTGDKPFSGLVYIPWKISA